MRKWTVGFVMLMLALMVPAVARAHEGHAHKVMGTVESVTGSNVMIKTPDGKAVTIRFNAKTKITRGKAKVDLTSVKVGDRLVAEGAEAKDTVTATAVLLADAAPITAKK